MNLKPPIYVTRPFLPPLEEYQGYLEKIWASKILTNNGPMHQELEKELSLYLDVPYISLFNSATSALTASFPVLDLYEGEVITTAFSFVATAHSIIWNNLTPIFVDIDPHTLNINPGKIIESITDKTKAIMAVHCYGRPCDTIKIQKIADDYNLRVIYDAAHAFGVKDGNGQSVLTNGDLSILSFHATKVFNTFEGGAIICKDKKTKIAIDQFKNFGIIDEKSINIVGMNGKMPEISASFGLLQLKYIQQAILMRKNIHDRYCEALSQIKGLGLLPFSNVEHANYSYFPILIKNDFPLTRDQLVKKMNNDNIFPRKYFYPLITDFAPYKLPMDGLIYAKEASDRILCLPLYPDMSDDEFYRIINSILH